MFDQQLDAMPPGGEELLLLAASSTTQAVAPILRATAELGIDDDVLEAVERQGLVAVVDGNLRLRHPVLRSVVLQRSTPAARREIGRASCRDRVCQSVEISVVAGS